MAESMMKIVIDTREQKPYKFSGAVVGTLSSGDYSIVGFESQIAIERKSKSDAFSSLGKRRDRFHRECKRLSNYSYAAIVIEATLQNFMIPPRFSKLNPGSAVASLLAWSVKYKLPVFFAGDRDHGMAVTGQLLRMFYKYNREDTGESFQ